MLDYGMPKIPFTKGEYRWFIKASEFDYTKRYLHLQKKRWWGWKTIKQEYIVMLPGYDFRNQTVKNANEIVRALTVDAYFPLGEVI